MLFAGISPTCPHHRHHCIAVYKNKLTVSIPGTIHVAAIQRLPCWRLPPPFPRTHRDLDAQKRNKTAKNVTSPSCWLGSSRVCVGSPAEADSPHPRQHVRVPQRAGPTTPTATALDVYGSSPRDLKTLPWNPAGTCPCSARPRSSGDAIDFSG